MADSDIPELWCPLKHGLSYSGLSMWLVDREAFRLRYFERLEPVPEWDKAIHTGQLVQAAIEGWILTGTDTGMSRFHSEEYNNQLKEFGDADKMEPWFHVSKSLVETWLVHLQQKIQQREWQHSERKVEGVTALPSGRQIKLKAYLDGEYETPTGGMGLMENKCRGGIAKERIISEIKWDLQYNIYLYLKFIETGQLCEEVWYQTFKRPSLRQKKAESKEGYIDRMCEDIRENPDEYMFLYLSRPTMKECRAFAHGCLYPLLDDFLDWYENFTGTQQIGKKNPYSNHYVMPYGIYNPFLEGTDERFRSYRLTGSRYGLRKF